MPTVVSIRSARGFQNYYSRKVAKIRKIDLVTKDSFICYREANFALWNEVPEDAIRFTIVARDPCRPARPFPTFPPLIAAESTLIINIQ